MIQDKRFAKLLKKDKRYKVEAYIFVFESLDYAQNRLHLGEKRPNEPLSLSSDFDSSDDEMPADETLADDDGREGRHITGQDLAEAARQYALDMYGYMAKIVLEGFGIRSTGDIGEIVYNMIKIGRMRKTPTDSREDFDDVYDFAAAFDEDYIIPPRKK